MPPDAKARAEDVAPICEAETAMLHEAMVIDAVPVQPLWSVAVTVYDVPTDRPVAVSVV